MPAPKIIYLTAGAAGMFCGSCMHDNALAKALSKQGWDIQLVPTYTPIRTDEENVSVDHVLFGGLNVYLQQKIPFFRYLPQFVDQFLDSPSLIRRVTSQAMDTDAKTLGSLTLSMLKGLQGNQRKEVQRMVGWLKKQQPDLVIFSNILIGGCIELLKQELNVPVLVTLQGDDVFLDSLAAPYREQCLTQIKEIAQRVDGFIVHTEFFRDYMATYFELDPNRIYVTPLGIDTTDFLPFVVGVNERIFEEDAIEEDAGQQETGSSNRLATDQSAFNNRRVIGYLARLAPEKGLQHLVEAFIRLKQRPGFEDVHLAIAGWLGSEHAGFAQRLWNRLDEAGLSEDYQYLGAVDRTQKMSLLSQLTLMSVPTEFKEPKGLYALEALAAGVPIVKPAHGAFPELIGHSSGGVLFEPGNIDGLVDALATVLENEAHRDQLGASGQAYVHQQRNSAAMATATAEVITLFLAQAK